MAAELFESHEHVKLLGGVYPAEPGHTPLPAEDVTVLGKLRASQQMRLVGRVCLCHGGASELRPSPSTHSHPYRPRTPLVTAASVSSKGTQETLPLHTPVFKYSVVVLEGR